MKSRLLHDDGARTFALVFGTDEDPVEGLLRFAQAEGLAAGHLTAIGAFARVSLGYFDWRRKAYRRIEMKSQVEVLSLVGDVAREGEQPRLHAHVVVGRADGRAYGGHLLAARVRPTLEVILTQPPAHLQRRFDPVSGLALIDL